MAGTWHSAQHLNNTVRELFDEGQVYRIDHYLGKETVQNLLVLRFANAVFEPVWNRNYVDNIQITVAEDIPVGDRGGYYDGSGVVRDMVQNHLLQLLSIVAMEPPSAIDAESLRDKKVEVLKAIRRGSADEVASNAVRGQYMGYLEEKGCGAGLNHTHLRRHAPLRGQLALAGSPLLPTVGQEPDLQGVGDIHPVQGAAPCDVLPGG